MHQPVRQKSSANSLASLSSIASLSRRGSEDIRQLEELLEGLHTLLKNPSNSINDLVHNVVDRIVSSMKYVRNDQDMGIICGDVVESEVFEEERDEIAQVLASYDDKDSNKGYVVYSLLYHLGQLSPNIYRKLLEDDWLPRLRDQILVRHGERQHPVLVLLMYELCKLQELSIADLEIIDELFLSFLCDKIEQTRNESEDENYALIKLLLSLNEQFMLKNAGRPVIENRVLTTVLARTGSNKTLSENLIFMFNRATDRDIQLKTLQFLSSVLKDPASAQFFYTNDTRIIMDVILREVRSVPQEDGILQQTYISILPLLVRNTACGANRYKSDEVLRLLKDLRDSPFGRPETKRMAEKVLGDCGPTLAP
ncbi:hypothetical protein HK104_011263 [Borealophlyctis nickersoniae]|nr:hypothetical protein HK104_011263 [Borealophlyctis nickersoniae]